MSIQSFFRSSLGRRSNSAHPLPNNCNRKEGPEALLSLLPMGYSLLEPRASSSCTECSIVASRMYSGEQERMVVYPGW